ncbi:MAG: fibronectin type III domain-containing protein [Parasporobacterium sp.]|nr:fibronectin type III domain-containing protein [Parasporobacterium sp.]
MKRKKVTAISVLLILVLIFSMGTFVSADDTKTSSDDGISLSEPVETSNEEAYGFIDESTRNEVLMQEASEIERYSLKDLGYVTPVKLQSPYGSCWAFASIAAAESSILSSGLAEGNVDLSEKHLSIFTSTPILDKNSSQYGEGYKGKDTASERLNKGGYGFLASSVYASGAGPVLESEDPSLLYRGANGNKDYRYFQGKNRPYSYSADDNWEIPYKFRDAQSYTLKESYVLPTPAKVVNRQYEYEEAGTLAIKEQLLAGRAVEIGFLADASTPSDSHVKSSTMSDDWANYGTTVDYSNHAVTIVGWDDNIGAEGNPVQFKEGKKPEKPGAWLVKNSWGSGLETFPNHGEGDWGIPVKADENDPDSEMVGSGYFWLSYYEHSLCYPEAVQFEKADPEITMQAYDYMPAMNMIANRYEKVAKTGNLFKSKRTEKLEQVSFQTTYPGTTVKYEVYLLQYRSNDLDLGYKIAEGQKTYKYGGFHKESIQALDGGPVILLKNQFYAVVVTQTTSDGSYAVAVPVNSADSFNAVINEGESLVCLDGSWQDLSQKEVQKELMKNSELPDPVADNFTIKAYTRPAEYDVTYSITGDFQWAFLPEKESSILSLNISGTNDAAVEKLHFRWSLENKDLAVLKEIRNGNAAEVHVKRDAEGQGIEGETRLFVDAYVGDQFIGRRVDKIRIVRPTIGALYCKDVEIRDKNVTEYTGKAIKPEMEAVNQEEGSVMVLGKDYKLTRKNNIKCGLSTVTATTLGDYKPGSVNYYFAIRPAKAEISRFDVNGTQLTVSIKSQKASGISGYQVEYRKKGDSNWSAKKLAADKTALTLTGLQAGKQYEVRARAYVTIPDAKKYNQDLKEIYYGAYSTVKTSTILKPDKAVISNIVAGKGQIAVTVKNQAATGIAGYQIAYRMDGASKWQTKNLAAGKTKLVIKNLKKGKRYQVKVRGVVKSGEKTIYGAFSEIKKSGAVK